MKNFYKFLGFTYLFVLILLAALTHFNVINIQYNDYINNSTTTNLIIKLIFYNISVYFLLLITARKFDLKHIKFMLFYLFLSCVVVFWFNQFNFFVSFVMPILLIVTLKIFKQLKHVTLINLLQRVILFVILTIAVQQFVIFVRFGAFDFALTSDLNVKHYVIMHIDLLILYFLYFKVVTFDDSNTRSLIFLFSKTYSISNNAENREKNVNNDSLDTLKSLKLRQRLFFMVIIYAYQFISLIVVFAIGAFNNRLAELTVMLFVFWIGRQLLGKSWHSNNLLFCSLATFASFYILTLLPISLKWTVFGAVSASALFTWVMYKLAEFEENYEELQKIKDFIESFDIDKTDEKELINRCELAGLSASDKMLAIDFFINKHSAAELSLKYHLAQSTIRNKKSAIRKKLINLY